MSFLEISKLILPLLLYVAAIALLITLIVLCVKLIKILGKVDKIVDDVDNKVKSLNGVFNVIDFCTDKTSYATNRIVDGITNFVLKIGKRKYNKKEEEEDYE